VDGGLSRYECAAKERGNEHDERYKAAGTGFFGLHSDEFVRLLR